MTAAQPARSRRLSLALTITLVFHGVLLLALVAVPVGYYLSRPAAPAGGGSPRAETSETTPAAGRIVEAPPPEPIEKHPELPPEQVAEPELRQDIAAAAEAAQARGEEENRGELEKLSDRLARVSTERSVADLSQHLNKWLGTENRATRPAAEPVAGAFDHGSAQFHDLEREFAADGTVRYVAILVDKAGRQQRVEVDQATGESTYHTLQIVKRNPLLDQVYRQITMPLLDKLLKQSAAPSAEPVKSEPVETSPASENAPPEPPPAETVDRDAAPQEGSPR